MSNLTDMALPESIARVNEMCRDLETDPAELAWPYLLTNPHAETTKAVIADLRGLTSALQALLQDRERLVEAWRKALQDHWLWQIECDHEAKTDVARCACGSWWSSPQPSVGQAVARWAEHVEARALPLPAPPRSALLPSQGDKASVDESAALEGGEAEAEGVPVAPLGKTPR